MRFRVITILLVMVTVAVPLAITAGSPPWARLGMAVSITTLWISACIIGLGLDQHHRSPVRELLLLLAGVGLFATGFAAGTLFIATVLRAAFVG